MEDQSTTTQRDFIGVRKRKWGKWVSEIREPGKKTRIWLGSYEEPEMAAAAYDVAAWHLKGQRARLNFPELADSLPKPASSSAEDVQSAAQEAAMQFKGTRQRRQQEAANVVVPATVGLSWSQIEAINASTLDSPKMWMELAGALLSGEPHHINEFEEWEELQNNSIWD